MTDDGGPAFPACVAEIQGRATTSDEFGFPGMSLRDYFAGEAARGAADVVCDALGDNDNVMQANAEAARHARAAYMVADALLQARKE